MTKLDDFSKIYNGGKSIAEVHGGAIIDLNSRDISTNNQDIKVTASTTMSGTSVSRLFDGIKYNDTNRWVSLASDNNPKLTITLDKPYTISQIIIHNGHGSGTNNFVQDVEIIIDGINQGKFIGDKTPIDINLVNEMKGRVIELKFPAGYNRIYEIEIYGKEHISLIWKNIGTTFAGEPTGLDFSLLPMNNVPHETYISPTKTTSSSGYHYYKFQNTKWESIAYIAAINVEKMMTADIAVYDKDYNEVWSQLNVKTVSDYYGYIFDIDNFFELSKNWQKHTMVIRSYDEISSVRFIFV